MKKPMNMAMNERQTVRLTPARIVGWGTIVSLIVLPAVAMQFTNEVNWTIADFAFAIVMLALNDRMWVVRHQAPRSGSFPSTGRMNGGL
jgi:hypothetical protein